MRREQAGPGERDYGGEAPLSEPEAAAVSSIYRDAMTLSLSWHCIPKAGRFIGIIATMSQLESEAFAERLALASNYQAVKLTDSDAGYKDWFIQQFRRPGFTVEVGFGVNPLPVESFASLYEELVPILLTAMEF